MKSDDAQNKPSHRQLRVAMIVRRALSDILRAHHHLMTISEVSLSRDLRYADIFIAPSFEQDEAQQKIKMENLVKAAPKMRHRLASAVYLKYVPHLRFHIDPSFDQAKRIDVLLSQDHF